VYAYERGVTRGRELDGRWSGELGANAKTCSLFRIPKYRCIFVVVKVRSAVPYSTRMNVVEYSYFFYSRRVFEVYQKG